MDRIVLRSSPLAEALFLLFASREMTFTQNIFIADSLRLTQLNFAGKQAVNAWDRSCVGDMLTYAAALSQ